ncbi:hypothetical protein IMZ48_29800 [Candidatus Bathyarchaeota archaeon]|nr:hypothetical protein [Candidatus Bathyarchaeota archaeon]
MGPVGPPGGHDRGTYVLAAPPATLIHDSDEHHGVSFIGAHPRAEPGSDAELLGFPRTRDLPRDVFGGYQRGEGSIHFSSAPLRGVVLAEVLQRGRGPYCRGLMLTYGDGCQRALGDCRVGVDPSRRYEKPGRLCICRSSEEDPSYNRKWWSAKVVFQGSRAHRHDDGESWVCVDMAGTLNFWFSHREQYLETIEN